MQVPTSPSSPKIPSQAACYRHLHGYPADHAVAGSPWFENGDAVIIKDAGAQVSNPFGTVIRSLLVAVLELHVQHIMVVGHTNCGAQNMNAAQMCAAMVDAGVSRQNIDLMRYCGVDFDRWLAGFETSEAEVRHTVLEVRDNPLIPAAVDVRGFVIDSHTGALAEVDCA